MTFLVPLPIPWFHSPRDHCQVPRDVLASNVGYNIGVVDHPGKDKPLLTINISQNVVCVICSVESFDLA